MPRRKLLDADDVVAVAVRAENVRDRDAVLLGASLELVRQAVPVDEEAVPPGPSATR